MNVKSKWVLLLLSVVLSIVLLAGCGSKSDEDTPNASNNETGTTEAGNTEATNTEAVAVSENFQAEGFPIVNEPITITMMGSKGPSHAEWKDMLVFKEYEKKTNIKVEWITVPQNGFVERRNISIAGGDLPDAFYRGFFTPADEVNYGSQGTLIPLNDLIDQYAPNIKAIFDEYPEVKRGITAPDGNIYSLPQIANYLSPRMGSKHWINKKWLDELDLPMPTTTEEFYNTLKAFKSGDPNKNNQADEIPLSGDKELSFINAIWGAWGLGTVGNKSFDFDLDSNGEIRFIPTDDKYKEVLEYVKRLHDEGLIDNEIFTQERAQFYAKGGQGLVGFFNQTNPVNTGPEYMDDYAPMPALIGPYGDQLYSPVAPMLQSQGTFAITSENKYPAETIRWIDYFYGEEGAVFLRLGVEGETYEVLPNGEYQYLDIIKNNPEGLSLDQAAGQFSVWPGGNVPQFINEHYDKTGNTLPVVLEAAALLEPHISDEIWSAFLFTQEEQEQLNALNADILTYVKEMKVKFITGVESFDRWDNYTSTVNKMGVDKLTDIYKAAYERYKK